MKLGQETPQPHHEEYEEQHVARLPHHVLQGFDWRVASELESAVGREPRQHASKAAKLCAVAHDGAAGSEAERWHQT